MKRLGSLLAVALFAGAITLGAYKLFFEKTQYAVITEEPSSRVFNTNMNPVINRGGGIEEIDFTIAAENTVHAVVNVTNVTEGRRPASFLDIFYGGDNSPRPVLGTGSGVIISSDGYIVTNKHVIENATQLEITLQNNKKYDAEVIGSDANTDIALIKIEADEQLPYLAFGDSDLTKIGEWVLAVGNPFNLTSTVTAGIVSAKARDLGSRNQSFIQTDAAVNPGNSGGALVNTNGDLVGINTAISSQTGSYVGYSFAVPSNIAKKVVEDIMEYGNVQKGLLGIRSESVNSPFAIKNGINEIEGVYVSHIEDQMGAQKADIRKGDIIKKIDDIKIKKFPDLSGYLSTKRPNDKVLVTVDRDGELLTLPVILEKRNSLRINYWGIEVKNLSKEDKKVFKTNRGVKIVGVPEKLQNLDISDKVLIAVDDYEIEDIENVQEAFDRISRFGNTSITMLLEGGERERLIFN